MGGAGPLAYLIDLASSDVVVAGEGDIHKALVIPQVQVRLGLEASAQLFAQLPPQPPLQAAPPRTRSWQAQGRRSRHHVYRGAPDRRWQRGGSSRPNQPVGHTPPRRRPGQRPRRVRRATSFRRPRSSRGLGRCVSFGGMGGKRRRRANLDAAHAVTARLEQHADAAGGDALAQPRDNACGGGGEWRKRAPFPANQRRAWWQAAAGRANAAAPAAGVTGKPAAKAPKRASRDHHILAGRHEWHPRRAATLVVRKSRTTQRLCGTFAREHSLSVCWSWVLC